MVRLKHRYLLLHFLCPSLPSSSPHTSGSTTTTTTKSTITSTLPSSSSSSSPLLSFHHPLPAHITAPTLLRLLKDTVQHLYGDYGLGLVAPSLSVKYLSGATATAIVRCARSCWRVVWAACAFITDLPAAPLSSTGVGGGGGGGGNLDHQRKVVVRVVKVSGTIRKIEEEAIRRAREQIWTVKGTFDVGNVGAALSLGLGLDAEQLQRTRGRIKGDDEKKAQLDRDEADDVESEEVDEDDEDEDDVDSG